MFALTEALSYWFLISDILMTLEVYQNCWIARLIESSGPFCRHQEKSLPTDGQTMLGESNHRKCEIGFRIPVEPVSLFCFASGKPRNPNAARQNRRTATSLHQNSFHHRRAKDLQVKRKTSEKPPLVTYRLCFGS